MRASIAAVGLALARPGMSLTPPQAFSIRSTDLSYCADWRDVGNRFDVLLDGQRMERVIAYDCRAGWVRTLRANDQGKLQLVSIAGELTVLEETLQGDVTVAWRDSD